MKKGLFDIILEQIMKERDMPDLLKEKPSEAEGEKTLEEQAKKAVKLRERLRLDDLLMKQKKEVEEKIAKEKRKTKRKAKDEAKRKYEEQVISMLESPTKNLSWKCISGGSHLQGIASKNALFEIKRGISAFELRPTSHEDSRINMRLRMKKIGMGSIFTSPDVQRLKAKADRLLEQVMHTEMKEGEQEAKKQA